jgi:hypothetical protein
MAQLGNQGAIAAGGTAAFSWSTSTVGASDPIAAAIGLAHRELRAAGWTQDALVSTRYVKTAPTMPVGEAAAMSSSATVAHDAVAVSATGPGTSKPDHLRMARPWPAEVPGLDGWESDGGASSRRIDRVRARGLGANHGS